VIQDLLDYIRGSNIGDNAHGAGTQWAQANIKIKGSFGSLRPRQWCDQFICRFRYTINTQVSVSEQLEVQMDVQLRARKILQSVNSWEEFVEAEAALDSSQTIENKLKGELFELLVIYYFKSHPVYRTLFHNVWHHSDLPIAIRDELNLPYPEIGVDIIAEMDNKDFCAIQCKFHQDGERNASYNELSTFFSVTEREHTYKKLAHRIVCTSANEVSSNVFKVHKEKLGVINRSDFRKLTNSDFENIHKLMRGEAVFATPFTPKPHQVEALDKAVDHLKYQNKSRGKIIHPCGAGKSLTAYWLTRRLAAKSVLIAVPSLALVKQTLNTWARESIADGSKMSWMAICSDHDVSKVDDPSCQTYDLGISVTTDSNLLARFLNNSDGKLKVVITTYQSSDVVCHAANENEFSFDLGVFDEAHKTVGHRTRKFSLMLNDKNLSISKRVFMTATERQFKGDSIDMLSMDDQSIYGEVVHQLSFREALEQIPPILSDYKVVTVAVSNEEIRQHLSNKELISIFGKSFSTENDSATVAASIALRKLVKERNINHAISFHSSIERATQFNEMMQEFNNFDSSCPNVFSYHVSGKQSSGKRSYEMQKFVDSTPSVISNARCLTEGVDIPAVDAVVFADPKQSVVDIVQAAGRAMRLHRDKEFGYIVIPVIIGNELEAAALDAFKQLIYVISALGITDGRIIDEVKAYVSEATSNQGEILEFVESVPATSLSFSKFVSELELMIWDRLSFAQSVVGESDFIKWMRDHTSLSEKSMKNYNQAIRKISNDLVKMKMAYSSLDDITENADLIELKASYFDIDEFKQLDVRGKGMYSAGFNKLIEYQKFKFDSHDL
jgi:predicted helicase